LDEVINDSEPLIVSRPGNTSVIIIPLDEYNAIKETEYLTSSPEMVKRLRSAENHMKSGKGIKINIEDL
jgi:antitoxin YefM